MTEITDGGRQRAADEPGSFDAMAVWQEAKLAYAPKLVELDKKHPQVAAIVDSQAATVIASAVAPLLAELAAVKAERGMLRLLVGRAQINGQQLPETWHRDATKALGASHAE